MHVHHMHTQKFSFFFFEVVSPIVYLSLDYNYILSCSLKRAVILLKVGKKKHRKPDCMVFATE